MKQYISTDEAVKLSGEVTIGMITVSHDIYESCLKKYSALIPQWPESCQFSSIAAVYNAGRIAGIRQERERRKAKA